MNAKQIFGIVLVAFGLMALLLFGLSQAIPSGSGSSGGLWGDLVKKGTKVECSFVVNDPAFLAGFRDAQIESPSCSKIDTCFKLNVFSFFQEKGTAELSDSQGLIPGASKKYSFIQGLSEKITLKGCTYDKSVNIRLLDEDGDLIQTKAVTIR